MWVIYFDDGGRNEFTISINRPINFCALFDFYPSRLVEIVLLHLCELIFLFSKYECSYIVMLNVVHKCQSFST